LRKERVLRAEKETSRKAEIYNYFKIIIKNYNLMIFSNG